jgi:hypothetical protein
MIDTAKIPGFWFPNRIIAIVGTLPWAYFLWSGYDLCYGHHAQTVTGPPNEGQFVCGDALSRHNLGRRAMRVCE